jgi:ABC-type uncharacterized transport system substrate-binding protein
VTANALFNNQREKLVGLAQRYGVPAIYDRRKFVDAGGLVSYGASNVEQYRQAGIYAGRVLGGEKPADLPVIQPTKHQSQDSQGAWSDRAAHSVRHRRRGHRVTGGVDNCCTAVEIRSRA